MYKGIIVDNICFGKLDVMDYEVVDVVKMVNVDYFIWIMLDGYEMEINFEGDNVFFG